MLLRVVLVCLLMSTGGCLQVEARAENPASCLVGKKMNVPEMLENGLEAQPYDTNRDGKVDMVTLSHPGDKPLFYIVDADHNGSPDAIYIDQNGDCNLRLYQDLTVPHDTGLNFQHPIDQMGREI